MLSSAPLAPFGRVIVVRGSQARLGVLGSGQIGQAEARATVGRFVSIRSGNAAIIAIITEVTCEHLPTGREFIAVASVDLLGEIQGDAAPRFQRGVTGYPAIGDIANHDHPRLGRRVRVEHWETAIEQGKTAAHNLVGAAEAYERLPYFFTDQYDLGMEYVGSVGPAGYDRVDIDGDPDSVASDQGAFRAYWVKDDVVVAAMHVNDWDASDAIRESIGTSR